MSTDANIAIHIIVGLILVIFAFALGYREGFTEGAKDIYKIIEPFIIDVFERHGLDSEGKPKGERAPNVDN